QPGPQHVRVDWQIGFRKLQWRRVAHHVVLPAVHRQESLEDLLCRPDPVRALGRVTLPVGAVDRLARGSGTGLPQVVGVGHNGLSIAEGQLEADPLVLYLRGEGDRRRLAIGPQNLVADLDLTHGGPSGRRRDRRVECQCLPVARPPRDYDELPHVHAAGQLVDVVQPHRDAQLGLLAVQDVPQCGLGDLGGAEGGGRLRGDVDDLRHHAGDLTGDLAVRAAAGLYAATGFDENLVELTPAVQVQQGSRSAVGSGEVPRSGRKRVYVVEQLGRQIPVGAQHPYDGDGVGVTAFDEAGQERLVDLPVERIVEHRRSGVPQDLGDLVAAVEG